MAQGGRTPVRAGYALEGGGVYGFDLGPHDEGAPLVLDPAVLIHAGDDELHRGHLPGHRGPDLTYNNGVFDAFGARVCDVRCPADLSLAKRAPRTGTVGGTLTYAVTVRNLGPGAATKVVVTDRLPRGPSS